MARFSDCPQIMRDFLSYHETIKGQSAKTIQEYYLDLRMFLRFMALVKRELPYDTDLETIDIKSLDLAFIESISVSDIFDFLSYLANDRTSEKSPDPGIGAAARARKLSAVKSFYKYLTHTKQLTENPVQDLEFPKLRKSLPRYLTLEQCTALLRAVNGPNAKRDYAIWARPARRPSTPICPNATKSFSRTTGPSSAPGTRIESASPRFTGW